MLKEERFRASTYRVGNNEQVGIGSGVSGGFGEVADNGGVGVEKVYHRSKSHFYLSLWALLTIAGHSRFPGNTSWDQNDLSTF